MVILMKQHLLYFYQKNLKIIYIKGDEVMQININLTEEQIKALLTYYQKLVF